MECVPNLVRPESYCEVLCATISDEEEACAPELGEKEQGSVSVVTCQLPYYSSWMPSARDNLPSSRPHCGDSTTQHQRSEKSTGPIGNLGQLVPNIHRRMNRTMENSQ